MLVLPVKRKWYNMVLSGEKKEEYRDIKPYWESRIRHAWQGSLIGGAARRKVLFRNGYLKDSPSFIAVCTFEGIREGNPQWGAEPGKEYFVFHILEVC